jgi:opacity protein-like surface antigen
MTRGALRWLAAAALLFGAAAPARGQVHVQLLGGMTRAADESMFLAGDIGARVGVVGFDLEVGRMTDILPSGLLDRLNEIQEEQDLPIRASASLPATYVLASGRLLVPAGPVQPFITAGVGVARVEPRLEITVGGISLGDVFGLTTLDPKTAAMGVVGGGLRIDAGRTLVDLGYRYQRVFTGFLPLPDVLDDVDTSINTVYAGVGVQF